MCIRDSDTTAEFKKAFDKLDRKLNAKRDKKARELRSLLLTESSGAKAVSYTHLDVYKRQVPYSSPRPSKLCPSSCAKVLGAR